MPECALPVASIRVFPYEISLSCADSVERVPQTGLATAGRGISGEPLRQGPAHSRSPGSASPQAIVSVKLSEKETKRFWLFELLAELRELFLHRAYVVAQLPNLRFHGAKPVRARR